MIQITSVPRARLKKHEILQSDTRSEIQPLTRPNRYIGVLNVTYRKAGKSTKPDTESNPASNADVAERSGASSHLR